MRKPSLLIVPDQDFWAFHNIALNMRRYLSDDFDVHIQPIGIDGESIFSDVGEIFLLAEEQADLLHFFWRNELLPLTSNKFSPYHQRLGLSRDEFSSRFIKSKIVSCGVYDHLYLDEAALAETAPVFTEILSGYYTSSRKLFEAYGKLAAYPPPLMCCEDGVDTSLFHPGKERSFSSIGARPVVIGWSGNSAWSPQGAAEDHKGFHTVILPALEILREQGTALEFLPADRRERLIPHREMPGYYAGLDILLCASLTEGTPNPVLEAMACGTPVVSTDVGIVAEAFGPEQSRYILRERSAQALAALLRELVLQPERLEHLSRENLYGIQNWDWSFKTRNFRAYFWKLLAGAAPDHFWLGADGGRVRAGSDGAPHAL